jgi:hypothetical protein
VLHNDSMHCDSKRLFHHTSSKYLLHGKPCNNTPHTAGMRSHRLGRSGQSMPAVRVRVRGRVRVRVRVRVTDLRFPCSWLIFCIPAPLSLPCVWLALPVCSDRACVCVNYQNVYAVQWDGGQCVVLDVCLVHCSQCLHAVNVQWVYVRAVNGIPGGHEGSG